MRRVVRPLPSSALFARVASVELGATLEVLGDDVAVLERNGEAALTLGPGEHELTAPALPAIASMVFGDLLDATLWFVRTAPLFGVKIAGPAGQILERGSGLYLRPRFAAEIAVAAADPSRLVGALASGGLPDEGGALLAFIRTQVLEAARRTLDAILSAGEGSLADIDALLPQLAEQLPMHLADLDALGLSVGAFSKVGLSLSPEETAALASAPAAGASSRVRAVHCPRCGAPARGAFCTQCGNPVDRTG